MNAYTSREELACLAPTQINHAEHYAAAHTLRPSLFARIAGFFARQATLNELRQLTDRELADIGLQRAELHAVFSPAFMAARTR